MSPCRAVAPSLIFRCTRVGFKLVSVQVLASKKSPLDSKLTKCASANSHEPPLGHHQAETDEEEGLFTSESDGDRPIRVSANGLYQEVKQVIVGVPDKPHSNVSRIIQFVFTSSAS